MIRWPFQALITADLSALADLNLMAQMARNTTPKLAPDKSQKEVL